MLQSASLSAPQTSIVCPGGKKGVESGVANLSPPLPFPPRETLEIRTPMEVTNDQKALAVRYSYSSHPPPINATGSSIVMSKKVKAGLFVPEEEPDAAKDWIFRFGDAACCGKPVAVYKRRRRREEKVELMSGNVELLPIKEEVEEDAWESTKRRRLSPGVASAGRGSRLGAGERSARLRDRTGSLRVCYSDTKERKGKVVDEQKKRWIELAIEGADPLAFVGLSCKVFWPLDDDWYSGSISKYISLTREHEVIYNDGDVESLTLSRERIKFHISFKDMRVLNLTCRLPDAIAGNSNHHEMVALSMHYYDCETLEPGDVVWAKLAGYPMWPAVIINETCVDRLSTLKPTKGDKSIFVQFFGTHDFSRVNMKQVKSFLSGLQSSFDQKSNQKQFERSLQEAKMYLCNHQLPREMIQMQKGGFVRKSSTESEDGGCTDSSDEFDHNNLMANTEAVNVFPLEIGNLSVISLGKIVCDSEFFHNRRYIWPEGYTASRRFISVSNPNATAAYRMEVLRNPRSKTRPLFRVIIDDVEQIDGATPKVCWKKVYDRIREASIIRSIVLEESKLQKSGSHMFGFSNPRVSRLIKALPNSNFCAKYFGKVWDVPHGYKPVYYERKDIDRCDVCDMDEEYEDNLFLQCDKCHMTVHTKCYGELKSSDEVLWLCNLCRPGAPASPPRCCLCPVIGGAMKPTTDGRWAHLSCAVWIPETCFLDIKQMEPIDGLCRINKNRWKLLCSICGVPYGACIQCSNNNCYVAYHPLCARAVGLCLEPEEEGHCQPTSDDDESTPSVPLISYCKKHLPSLKELSPVQEEPLEPARFLSTYVPQSNLSGCARCEPYNSFGRRGQKEPHAILAASKKQLFLDNTPYMVSGCRQSGSHRGSAGTDSLQVISFPGVVKNGISPKPSLICSSLTEKYLQMKATYKKRLAFGKSKVHGFGVFAKVPHKTGDMIVEYTGEVVRPRIADIRERCIYNSLVGAGTYMFHIDNERVVDATRAGSIAHLINHSCEPNCYSRMVTIQGEEHIIICAKRDIERWEELAYDYRFLSKDEHLACFCGFPKCRGVVNDVQVAEQILMVPRSKLIPWKGD